MTKNEQNNNEQSYLTKSINYVYDHPYQTAAMITGTLLVGYNIPAIISYGSAYYAASAHASKARAVLRENGGLACVKLKEITVKTRYQ